MTSNFTKDDSILGIKDLDDEYITEAWLVDRFVGNNMFAWGGGSFGVLGLGNTTNYSSPMMVGTLNSWKSGATGALHTLYLRTDGTVWGCGWNLYGSLGNNSSFTQYSSPIQVGSFATWKEVSCPVYSTILLGTNGTLWSCGYNFNGQLGLGNTTDKLTPVQIGSLTDWRSINSSGGFTLATKTNGTLWGWGYNPYGQLGNGNITNYSSPIQIGSLSDWKQLSTASSQSLAIKIDGTLWAWGSNAYGQLGNGNTTSYSSPIQIGSLTNWKIISAGNSHSLAIKTDGTLWGWGLNTSGQLGNSSVSYYSSPIQIGSLTNWKTVHASNGDNFSLAIKTDGTLWAWGINTTGQLGNGNTTSYSSPVQVGSLTNWKTICVIAAGSAMATTYSDLT